MAKVETYICDHCHANIHETKAGRLYGPLIVSVAAPHHTEERTINHFCSIEHATKWMTANIGKTVLT